MRDDKANDEMSRKALADEIRSSLWPYVEAVRKHIAAWIPNHIQPIDLIPLPTRPLSLTEKCAVLAAFHDSVEEGEAFWESQVPDGELPKTLSWEVLVSAASKVIPRPKDSLRTLLAIVPEALAVDPLESNRSAKPPQLNRRTHETNSISIALSELDRISARLKQQLGSKVPAIALFSWTQYETGRAGEPLATISLVDAAGALQAEPRHILWCGANTWRPSEQLRDERGKVITTPALGADNQPIIVDGKPLFRIERTPIEYRGMIAVERDAPQSESFLPTELHTGFWGGATTELLSLMTSAGESLARITPATANMWSDISFSADLRSGNGGLVLWLSAMVVLNERGELIGNLVSPFWHWSVSGVGRCHLQRPGIDLKGIDTSRRVARIHDPVRASLQLIDWLNLNSRQQPAMLGVIGNRDRVDLKQHRSLLIDEIFSQGLSITEKLKVATTYGPETYYTFKEQWDRLKDGLNDAGNHLDEFPPKIREAVERIAAIVVAAASGISFADVCKALAESELSKWSDIGWRAYTAATKPSAVWWAQKESSDVDDPRRISEETRKPSNGSAIDNVTQRSLERLHQRFSKGAENQRNLSALLVHSAELCFPEPPSWPDDFEPAGKYRLNIQGGPRCDERQLLDENGRPLVAAKPIANRAGQEILFSDGQPVAMYLGARRTYSLFGDQFPGSSEFDYSSAVGEYMDAASTAGLIIDRLPGHVKAMIWRDWQFGFIKPDSAALWTNAVFELAWQEYSGTGLAAERWAWLANNKLKIGDLAWAKESPLASIFGDLVERAGDPPRYWYSWLPNIWRASANAIDVIDSLTRELETENVKSSTHFAPNNSSAAAQSQDSALTIDQLELKTPKLDKMDSKSWLRFDRIKSAGETPNSKSLREQRSAGKKTEDTFFGVCKAGRIWRKEGRVVWYYVPSLLPRRDKTEPLISAALRLISTVD